LTPECWRYSVASHRDCRQVLWAVVHDVLRASLAVKFARRDDLPAIERSNPLNAAHQRIHVTLYPSKLVTFPFFNLPEDSSKVSISEYLNPAPSGNNTF
jgi:hypothetical protein